MHPPSLRYTRAPITAFKKKNQWLHQNRVCVERIVGGAEPTLVVGGKEIWVRRGVDNADTY